jgi:hypothetical protein
MCVNNDNKIAIINNNYYGRPQDLILLYKIPMGTRQKFFEIYRKFGHAPSKNFRQPCPASRQMKLADLIFFCSLRVLHA